MAFENSLDPDLPVHSQSDQDLHYSHITYITLLDSDKTIDVLADLNLHYSQKPIYTFSVIIKSFSHWKW